MAGIYDFTATSLAGEDVPLKRFEGQVLLIVNTASQCGFTPQYDGLEKLWRDQRSFMITEGPTEVLRTALAKLILRGAS